MHTVQVAPELIISGEKLKLFQKETQGDEILSRVIKYYKEGWPKNVDKNINGEIKHYYNNKVDVTVQDSLVHFNNKLIIPKNLRKAMLKLLHETHLVNILLAWY